MDNCNYIDNNIRHEQPILFGCTKEDSWSNSDQGSYYGNWRNLENAGSLMKKEIDDTKKTLSRTLLDKEVKREDGEDGKTKLDFKYLYKVDSENFPETELIYQTMTHKNQVSGGDRAILNHPIVVTFVELKSLKMKKYRLLDAAIWLIFLATSFAFHFYYSKCLFSGSFKDKDNATISNNPPSYCKDQSGRLYYIWYAFLGMAPFILCCEIFRMTDSRFNYFSNFQSYCSLFLVFSSGLCCHYLDEEWQKIFSVMGMISCGIILMMVLGTLLKIQRLEIMMFRQVFLKSIRVIIPFVTLIMCFGFVFESILYGSTGYENDGYGMVHIAIMMLGGIDDKTLKLNDSTMSDYILCFCVVVFIFLIVIVLMNLLTALAIDVSTDMRSSTDIYTVMDQVVKLHCLERLLGALHFPRSLYCLAPDITSVKLNDWKHEHGTHRHETTERSMQDKCLDTFRLYILNHLSHFTEGSTFSSPSLRLPQCVRTEMESMLERRNQWVKTTEVYWQNEIALVEHNLRKEIAGMKEDITQKLNQMMSILESQVQRKT